MDKVGNKLRPEIRFCSIYIVDINVSDTLCTSEVKKEESETAIGTNLITYEKVRLKIILTIFTPPSSRPVRKPPMLAIMILS